MAAGQPAGSSFERTCGRFCAWRFGFALATTIEPQSINLTVLPQLLRHGGWATCWQLFRTNLRPVLRLAIRLCVGAHDRAAIHQFDRAAAAAPAWRLGNLLAALSNELAAGSAPGDSAWCSRPRSSRNPSI